MFEFQFFIATTVNLLVNLFYTIFALMIGVFSLKVIDKNLLKSIDLEEEIKRLLGNHDFDNNGIT